MTEGKARAFSDHDRRSYFRIDDTVRLSLRAVSESEIANRLDRLEQDLAGNFAVMSSLAAITSQMAVGLRRIETRDPDLAAYLRAIDQKIEVIGRAFLAQEPEIAAEKAVAVNLSAGGMCVAVDQGFDIGQIVEIRLLLFPSFTGLLLYGTVVECGDAPVEQGHGRKLVRVEFTHIREQDRELLIRHLLRRQSAQLRDREG